MDARRFFGWLSMFGLVVISALVSIKYIQLQRRVIVSESALKFRDEVAAAGRGRGIKMEIQTAFDRSETSFWDSPEREAEVAYGRQLRTVTAAGADVNEVEVSVPISKFESLHADGLRVISEVGQESPQSTSISYDDFGQIRVIVVNGNEVKEIVQSGPNVNAMMLDLETLSSRLVREGISQ